MSVGSKPIKVGIAGLGRAGLGMHCPGLESRKAKFRIVAVCDRSSERRELAAAKYGCRTYRKIEDLVCDDEVELVDIATRSSDRFKHAGMALRSGKHVQVEKPMCITYNEARALRRIAVRSRGNLYVHHNRRFEPAFQHVREIIASGILGGVYEIKLRRLGYQRRDDWQTLRRYGGGQLLNWGPHIIDHALQLLESPVKSVWSDLKRIAAVGDAEDHVRIILAGANGRIVDLEISGGAALDEPEYTVYGARGALKCDGTKITLKYLDPRRKLAPRRPDPGTPGVASFGTAEKLSWIEKTVPVKPRKKVDLACIWDELYRAIRRGARFPVTVDQAVEVMRIISAARKGEFSSESRRLRARGQAAARR